MPSAIGTVVPVSDKNEALVGLKDGIFALDLGTKALTHLCNPDNTPNNRLNDGKCSPEGRFWVGSMDFDLKPHNGELYVMDRDRKTVRSMVSGTSISNGIAWSLDSKTMYYIDTPTMVVQAFDYDVVEGKISNSRTAFTIPPNTGYPDGCVLDSTGNLWIAQWGGSRVVAYSPSDGTIVAEVHLPVSNVTSVTFGGADLSDLYITTARKNLNEE